MEDLLGFLNFTGLDLGSGKRNIDLKKENAKISERIPQTVSEYAKFKEIPMETALQQFRGGQGLIPVKPERKERSTLTKALNFLYGSPEGVGTELVGGKLVGEDRAKGLGRFTKGLADALTLNITDYDKRGGGFLGLSDVNPISGLGAKPTDFKLDKTTKDLLKTEAVDQGSTNPVDSLDDAMKAYFGYKKESDKESRKGRMADAFLESAVMRANMPFITNTMKDLSTFKQRQLLDAEKIKQSLPNAVQQRLLTADTGFKQQADAIAGQYLAAVEGAKAGTFPRNVSFSA